MTPFLHALLAAVLAVSRLPDTVAEGQPAAWPAQPDINAHALTVAGDDLNPPMLPGINTGVGNAPRPALAVSYRLTPSPNAELFAGTSHAWYSAVAADCTGTPGTSEAQPPFLFLQYHGRTQAAAPQPYSGLGANYARFPPERGSARMNAMANAGDAAPATFSLRNAFGLNIQQGVRPAPAANWFVDAAQPKTGLRTAVRFSTEHSQRVRLDPVAACVAFGYQF